MFSAAVFLFSVFLLRLAGFVERLVERLVPMGSQTRPRF